VSERVPRHVGGTHCRKMAAFICGSFCTRLCPVAPVGLCVFSFMSFSWVFAVVAVAAHLGGVERLTLFILKRFVSSLFWCFSFFPLQVCPFTPHVRCLVAEVVVACEFLVPGLAWRWLVEDRLKLLVFFFLHALLRPVLIGPLVEVGRTVHMLLVPVIALVLVYPFFFRVRARCEERSTVVRCFFYQTTQPLH